MVDWLLYDPLRQTLICKPHGYATQQLSSHLRLQHPLIDPKTRSSIIAEHSALPLRWPLKHEYQHGPDNPLQAINGLTIHNGLACSDCGYLSKSRKALKVHCKAEHAWQLSKADRTHWAEVKLQTFFTVPGSAIHYFCVNDTGPGGMKEVPADVSQEAKFVDDIKERWAKGSKEQEQMRTVLVGGAAKHETTNWLRRAGWAAHFKGKDIGEIHRASLMPSQRDSELHRMCEAMNRLFFGRCIEGLKEMPLMTRLLLASPHPLDAHSRPFGALQERSSMERYLTYWKRFVWYCLQVIGMEDSELFERHGCRFTDQQRARVISLRAQLQNNDGLESALDEELFQMSIGFWTHKLEGNPFDSPLWHFIAVMGIDSNQGQFKPAHLFTYVLAGFVYVGRALVAEWAMPVAKWAFSANTSEYFEQVRREWLCKATYAPMGYMLSLFLYGRKIAQETGSRLMISWSQQGDRMFFMGKPIVMADIQQMVADLTHDTENMLWDELMFKEENDARFIIPLHKIEDDLTFTQRGKSFIHRNSLDGREMEMLTDIVDGHRKGEFLDSKGQWKWDRIQRYRKAATKWLGSVQVLIHMASGQPSRGEEINGLRLVNGITRDRSVFVIDGEVVLITQYHKSLAHFDSPKVIPRFLPSRIGQLLVMYMIFIRPLIDKWEAEQWAQEGKMQLCSDFIWHNNGRPWESGYTSQLIAKETLRYMGQRITLKDWRHIAIAISRKHARQSETEKADFDEEHDDDEYYEAPDDLAAGHSGKTAAHYGVTVDVLKCLTADSLEIFRQVSHRWHKFLGILKVTSLQKRIAASGAEGDVRHKRSKTLLCRNITSGPIATEKALLEGLCTILRDNHAQYRSPQQAEAIRLASVGASPLVVVLPTGGGKTAVFMVPAMLPKAQVTVVVAPYAELKKQLVARCRDAGIDCEHWPQAREVYAQIVLVSAEAASSDNFLQWASELVSRKALDRIVVDECHVMFTAADEYRKKLRSLALLRQLGCPFVFLTGTLPPLQEREFEEAMHLRNPIYIRASCHRLNIEYSVKRIKNGHGPMEAKKLLDARRKVLKPGQKGIVYCISHAKCKALARHLQCHYYHGVPDSCSAHFMAQREEGFEAWLRGDTPYIVATAALGTGLDMAGIVLVVHVDAPYSLIDYAQEAGRAGRSGERAEAVMLVEDKDWPSADISQDVYDEMKTREVRSLVRTEACRRTIIGRCLDNDVRDCRAVEGMLCDNCQHQHQRGGASEGIFQGLILSQAAGRKVARGLEEMQTALEEIKALGTKDGCRICWVFAGVKGVGHSWWSCTEIEESLSFESCMAFQRKIDYRRDKHAQFLSCFYCHVSQKLCLDGFKTKGMTCQWKHIIIPAALAATTEADIWDRVCKLAGKEFKGEADYNNWLACKHKKLICGLEMTNAMAVFEAILQWRVEKGIGEAVRR